MPTSENRIRLDLNGLEFQNVFLRLGVDELRQVVNALRRLSDLDWQALYAHTGFRWEAVEHLQTASGARVYSLRLSQRIRAIALRDGNFLRLLALHPEHDSAYRRR